MKKVPFPLQAVHDLRELRREEMERQLAEAAAEIGEAKAQLEEATRLHSVMVESYAQNYGSGVIDPEAAEMRANYLAALVRRIQAARAHLTQSESAYEAQRQLAIAAARDAEVTAKLRAKHNAQHASEAARREQIQLDEMATAAQARRMAEGD